MNLSRLAVGSLTLTPTFDEYVTSYKATTTNSSNVITAVAFNTKATVDIMFNGTKYKSGNSLTWKTGKNVVDINVSNGDVTKTYTIEVTK